MRPTGSAAELEVRRRIAERMLNEGKGVSEIACAVGASTSSVSRWKQALATGGTDAMRAKPHPGRPSRLSAAQRRKLERLLAKGPLAAGYTNDLWTCPRVAELIEAHFGVSYHSDHVWRILQSLGWSCQKPEQRARERDENAIVAWRKQDWPRIKKNAARRAKPRVSR